MLFSLGRHRIVNVLCVEQLAEKQIEGHERDPKEVEAIEAELAAERGQEATSAGRAGELMWSSYRQPM